MHRSRCLLAGAIAVTVFPCSARAQIRASEHATVSQTVDGTTVSMEYYRPRARGRDTLFGGQVHWEEVWTPGANWATTFEVDNDVTVNGTEVPEGKYSVWMVVVPGDEWEVILDPNHRLFHIPEPEPHDDQIRFMAEVHDAPHAEVLTWSFPEVSSTGMTAAMHWGETLVPLEITVPPSRAMTVASEVADRYVGTYEVSMGDGRTSSVEVTYRDNRLYGYIDPPPWPGANEMLFLSVTDEWFNPGWLQDGELFDVSADILFEFHTENGRATGFDVRGLDDQVFATGTRVEGS